MTNDSVSLTDRVSYVIPSRGNRPESTGFGDVVRLQTTTVVVIDKKHVGNKRTVIDRANITSVTRK